MADIIQGTLGDDVKFGTEAAGTFLLLDGNDFGSGRGGNDTMFGGNGNDALDGGAGDDVLIGGGGNDAMFGRAGHDTFKYLGIQDSGTGFLNRDTIQDFARGEDLIDLSAIDANVNASGNQAFNFIGGASFHHVAGEMRSFVSSQTGELVLAMDVNGDGKSDMNIEVEHVTSLSLADFLL